MAHIGFIGLGIMGAPMAGHLIAAGHTVYTHTHGATPAALIEAGARPCTRGAEVARQADIIITMVPDTPHVEDALFNPEGVAAGLTPGKIVVDMSSISPVATKDFARRIAALGCDYLDAPVSGGEVGAKAASHGVQSRSKLRWPTTLFSSTKLIPSMMPPNTLRLMPPERACKYAKGKAKANITMQAKG